MLVVIFGAGASYDSNLAVPVPARDDTPADVDQWGLSPVIVENFAQQALEEFRPPLANQLFAMDRDVHRAAAVAFERVAPALQDLQEDVEVGLSIEAALQRMQEESDADPDVRARLLSLRFYLQRVLTLTPRAWDREANGLTSYVSLLSQLGRWARAVGEQLCLVTFNYDDLLERAVAHVFGHHIGSFGDYLSHDLFRLYKPHGSINWAYELSWSMPVNVTGNPERYDFQRNAIVASDPNLEEAELAWRDPTASPHENHRDDGRSGYRAYVPAIAIPVEKKPGLILPPGHEDDLRRDLRNATAVLAVGWRAREAHVIALLKKELPTRRQLHVVAESEDAAWETATTLWQTGKFSRHAAHLQGFAQFARPAPSAPPANPLHRLRAQFTVDPVLRQQVPMSWVDPGPDDPNREFWDPAAAPAAYAPFEVPSVQDAAGSNSEVGPPQGEQ